MFLRYLLAETIRGLVAWNQGFIFALACMHTKIDVLDKPIERIRETCDMVGFDFEGKFPELETYLESLVANGESDEGRLTVNGLAFLKGSIHTPKS